LLIAEIGNNHFGNFRRAKDLIYLAKECGADAVKFQAFEAKDVIGFGHMPPSFYEECEFTRNQYVELYFEGKELEIPVFFSIWSESMKGLRALESYHKLSHKQLKNDPLFIERVDTEKYIISLNEDTPLIPNLKHANVLLATNYLTLRPKLHKIMEWSEYLGRRVGLSDHTIGIDTCMEALTRYNVPIIEKHFTLMKNVKYMNQFIFRDTIHAATPKEMAILAREMHEKERHGI